MIHMKSMPGIIRTVSTATAANLIGRAANVLIALSVITLCGADARTDLFFFIMAIAFFFFGVLANAITTAVTPLLIAGRLVLTSKNIRLSAASGALVLWVTSWFWSVLVSDLHPAYVAAIGLMTGAGIGNGFTTGVHYAADSFLLPGISWSLRLLPLVLLMACGSLGDRLAWLALGVGVMDWLRFVLLSRSPRPREANHTRHKINKLINAFPVFGKVMAASVIMGLNPIIDRIIARLSGAGAVSVLEAGERIYMMLASVSTIGMMSVLLTRLSREAAGNELEANWPKTLRMTTLWSGFWMIFGIVAGYWVLDWWLDAFTPLSAKDARAAQWVYWYYLTGLPAFVWGLTYVKRLQALQKWWVMVGTSTLAVVLNIPFSLTLRRWLGIPGIALATTLIGFINCAVLMVAAHTPKSTNRL